MNEFYRFSKKEKILNWAGGIAIIIAFAYFFYRSVWALFILFPLVFIYQKKAEENQKLAKREELCNRFKEIIEIIAGNLRAGYSIENAFFEAEKDILRTQTESSIINMLSFIRKGLENNIPLELRLKDAGEISGINEIIEFAEVFGVARNSGGNMIDFIGQFSNMIGDKIETEKEINVAISARRGEQKIMNVVPFIILLYLDITSPNFFSSLYHNFFGITIMTGCLALYLLAYAMSVKMLRIKI